MDSSPTSTDPDADNSLQELRDLRQSPLLKATGLLMLLNIPLALWVLLGSLGLVPFDMLVFWAWIVFMAVLTGLQLHPTVRRARELSQNFRNRDSGDEA